MSTVLKPLPNSEEMKAVLKWREEEGKRLYPGEWVAVTVESHSPPRVELLGHNKEPARVREAAKAQRIKNPGGSAPIFMKIPADDSEDILL